MSDVSDWSATAWEGNRRRQHQEFLALSFRDKLIVLEQLGEVTRFFAERRQADRDGTHEADPASQGTSS